MKICGQVLEITLLVYGREMNLSEEWIIAIAEKHLARENTMCGAMEEVAKTPTEDKWFEVNPLAIDQELFQKKRRNSKQEKTRKLILEAFVELSNNSEKYGGKFETMIPKRTWQASMTKIIKEFSGKFGGHTADWVEQALEWAQRIANGETWEKVCNDADTARNYRLIIWKDGNARVVGGSRYSRNNFAASNVSNGWYHPNFIFDDVVPLIARYKEVKSSSKK